MTMILEQFIEALKPNDKIVYHSDNDNSTNAVLFLDDGIRLSVGVFDDEKEDAPVTFCLQHGEELLVLDALPLSEILEAFTEYIKNRP